MRPRYALVRRKASELLQAAQIVQPPVPIEQLAELAGAVVRYEPYEGKLSGLLYRSTEGSIIGINSLHPAVRQRFSIAHEVGHLMLHEPQLQIDEHAFVVFRDLESSKGADPAEIEANQFAAALLMPKEMLAREVLALGKNADVGDGIHRLSQVFEVSLEAMTFRLTSLRWLIQ